MMSDQDTALEMCRQLSGFNDVSARFTQTALGGLVADVGCQPAERLLEAFAAGGLPIIMADATFAPLVEKLLIFLYTGFADDPQIMAGAPENHFESLMWRAVGAHPPGLSGGYFGHWHYPPEDLP